MPVKKNSRPRRKTKKAAKATSDRLRLRVALALLFIFGFLAASLIGLSYLRESLRQVSSPGASMSSIATSTGDRQMIEDIRVELESALLRSGFSWGDLDISPPFEEGPVRIEVRGDLPPPSLSAELQRRLERFGPEVRLESRPKEGNWHIFWRGTPCFALHFRSPAETLPLPLPESGPWPQETPPAAGARMAIIMDDLGRDLAYGRALAALDLPITFSILPGEEKARQMADLAYSRGHEVLIHLPMEPQGYPGINPGHDALFVGMQAEDIQRRVRQFIATVPHAVGGNNHMGSRFTENSEGMQAVLGELKGSGMFFVDSLTSGRSVGLAEARRAGIPAGARDLFLDNEQDVEKIAAEIRRLVRVARRQGHAIGICHPYPETLEALRRESAALRRAGVEIVPVSRLVR